MLGFDECRLMVDQSINVHPHAPRLSVLYLYPDDIEAYHRQVRSSGLPIPDLDTTFYGMREFRIDDRMAIGCGSDRTSQPERRDGVMIRKDW